MSASAFYDKTMRTADDCPHEVQGGDIVRPWCGTPVCALCRRRGPYRWRTLDDMAARTPTPSNVIPLNGSRKLF